MSSGKPPFWVVIRAHVLADPRKTGALGLLTLVMVGMYLRLLVFNDGPKPASAASTSVVPTDGSGATPAPGNDPTTPKPAAIQRIQLRHAPATTLQRDPFSLPVSLGVTIPSTNANTTTPDTTPQAANPDLIRRVRELAGQLKLQSTFVSTEPLATINGQVLRVGEQIEGFLLEQVEPTFVVVQKEGVSVKVTLK